MSAADFTHAGYRALLRALAERGYRPIRFEEVTPAARHVILRHDIDQSIAAARALAEVEGEEGVSATYFVLLRSEMYNTFSRAGTADLRRLLALGHCIGLHLDASLYADDDEALDVAAARECAVLEEIVGAPVSELSFHRPHPRLLGLSRDFAGRRHAYQSRYFRDIGYCSDSRGTWGHGRPLQHPAIAAGRAIQLLTHPIWWLGESPVPPRERLEALLAERDRALRRELWDNCAPFRDDNAREMTGR